VVVVAAAGFATTVITSDSHHEVTLMSQGWIVDALTDTITFNTAPPAGTNNIVVNEYASASFNATPLWAVGAWNPLYGYPSEAEFYAERLILASTVAQPQTMWMSRIGDYSFHGKSTPIQDDDAITYTINARQLNTIQELVALESLIVLTSGGEWRGSGGQDDVLTPSTVAFKPQTHVGSSPLHALIVEESAIFTQNKGYSVRGLSYTFEKDGYSDTDLTAFAAHLVEGYTITDWAYQAVPYSAVYACRSDGMLLSMTYKREHRVVAWARQPTDGVVESVAQVPEPGANAVYVVVQRVINGQVKRFIERFADQVDDIREWVGSDCSLTYDGRNRSATTLTLSSNGFTIADAITITASASTFAVSNVGDEVVLDYVGLPLRIRIDEFVSATQVIGYPERDVPASLRTPATSWALAVDTVTGLGHLEGKLVRIGCDGFDYDDQFVTGGKVTLTPPGVIATVGLPYRCDFESLDFTIVGGQPVGGRTKICRRIDLLLRNTKGIKAGTQFDTLEELKPRLAESLFLPPADKTETVQLDVYGEWQKAPRVCIRHDSAYPATVLSMTPIIEFGQQ
jgi:hypothetical protein